MRGISWCVFVILGTLGVSACTGGKGDAGDKGEQGPVGTPGPQGPQGDAGATPDVGLLDAAGPTGCTAPCHGFGNVVDQWKFSKHYIESTIAADEPGWTGSGACGGCHAIDGIPRRLAGTVGVAADAGVAPVDVPKGHLNYVNATGGLTEIGYSGPGTVAVIHCTTCHDFNPGNDPHNTGKYIPGSAPLRVPAGAADFSMIEKTPSDAGVDGSTATLSPTGVSAGNFKQGNTCVMCHKSRKDVTFYITGANKMNSAYWGPHEGPQADVYSGKGGYHFPGQAYGNSVHTTIASACVSCHMQPVASNMGVPDHSMHPALAYCVTCHTTYTGTNFDVQGGQSIVRATLKELEAALNAKGLLTRGSAAPYPALTALQLADGNFEQDKVRPGSNPDGTDQVLDSLTAGVVYNYLIIARSKDFGVHNPTYAKQLLWDSIKQLTGANPKSLPARPS